MSRRFAAFSTVSLTALSAVTSTFDGATKRCHSREKFSFPELPVDTFCVEGKIDDDSAWIARFAYSLKDHPTVPQETPVLPMLQGKYETHEADIINYIRPVLHQLNVDEKNAVREWFTELGKAFDMEEKLDPRDVLVHVEYHKGKPVLDKEVTVELSSSTEAAGRTMVLSPLGRKPSAPKYVSRENGWGSVVKRKRVESDFGKPSRKKRFRRPADPVAIASGNYEYIDPTQETPNVMVEIINNTKGMVGAEVKFGLCEDDRGKELATTGFVKLTGSYRAFRLDTNSMPEKKRRAAEDSIKRLATFMPALDLNTITIEPLEGEKILLRYGKVENGKAAHAVELRHVRRKLRWCH
ncbi:hypothetical protein FOL46_009516 [Perkinsus olseni]|uniref:Uncharacterized protein n=1 Tax=Perkinsus olseni TaxID=32597 RepID=A0A7J6KZF5_PEROL|nr:hypothetical protein FOL46_009516 [Perkinsus olseni]